MDRQTYHISGMMCGACAFTIKKQLLRLKGVKNVLIDINKQELKLAYDHKRISERELIQSVAPFGYVLHRTPTL